MKLITLAITILLSASTYAQSPATEAVDRLFSAGNYEGKNGTEKCTVIIQASWDSVTIAISNKAKTDFFTLVNASNNYTVNDTSGAISATQSLNYPRYIKGGTKVLNVVPDDIDQVEFSVTQLLLDHQGNDLSTFSSCTLTK